MKKSSLGMKKCFFTFDVNKRRRWLPVRLKKSWMNSFAFQHLCLPEVLPHLQVCTRVLLVGRSNESFLQLFSRTFLTIFLNMSAGKFLITRQFTGMVLRARKKQPFSTVQPTIMAMMTNAVTILLSIRITSRIAMKLSILLARVLLVKCYIVAITVPGNLWLSRLYATKSASTIKRWLRLRSLITCENG
jgi:hypothetical protein